MRLRKTKNPCALWIWPNKSKILNKVPKNKTKNAKDMIFDLKLKCNSKVLHKKHTILLHLGACCKITWLQYTALM